MRRFGLLILMTSMAGCQTFGGAKPQSQWNVLEAVDDAKCGVWPMRERDLQLNDVLLVQGGKGRGFAVTGMRRDTATMHYYAPFDGDVAVDVDDFVALDLGRGAVYLGGIATGGQELAFVARAAGDKSTLEVRTVRDNVVRYKGPLADVVVEEGTAQPVIGGAWLTVKGEDGSYRVIYVELGKGDKIESRPIPGATHKDVVRVMPRATAAGGALVVWKEGETGKPFKVRWVGTDGKSGDAVGVDVGVESQVESWTAIGHGGGYYLAVVDGDSLIGKAELKIAHFSWNDSAAQVRWAKGEPLLDEHVTEPLFVATERGLEALVLKWIDEESTIARYMVAGGTVGKPQYSGIFPKGSRIMEAYVDADADDTFVVTRNRGESGWVFRICEI